MADSMLFCAGITCETPNDPADGTVYSISEHSDGSRSIPYGTEVTFSCNDGYGLVGSKTITCQSVEDSMYGALNPVPPTCQSKLACACMNKACNWSKLVNSTQFGPLVHFCI